MPSRRVNVWLSPSSLMSTPSAISGKGLTCASSLYRPDITFWSISVETESVVSAESRSLTVCSRLMTMDLLLPPPPPPPPPLKTPQPDVPSRVAPARPVPLIFKKSLRLICVPASTLLGLILLVTIRSSFPSPASDAPESKPDYHQYVIRTGAEFRRPTGAHGSHNPKEPSS